MQRRGQTQVPYFVEIRRTRVPLRDRASRFRTRLFPDEFGVDRDVDFVAHQHAAGFERGVPGQAKVLSIDNSRRFDTYMQRASSELKEENASCPISLQSCSGLPDCLWPHNLTPPIMRNTCWRARTRSDASTESSAPQRSAGFACLVRRRRDLCTTRHFPRSSQ
jgi:hypothetical protein